MSNDTQSAPSHNRQTSSRHTGLLDGYKSGKSIFKEWADTQIASLTLEHWEWGHVSLSWHIDDRFIMPDGVMFGGHIASVADHLVALGAMTVLSQDEERFRTSRLETNFFRPLMKCEAKVEVRVTNVARRLIHVEADVLNDEGKLAVRVHAVQVRVSKDRARDRSKQNPDGSNGEGTR